MTRRYTLTLLLARAGLRICAQQAIDHLAFRQEVINWQIWIDRAKVVPRKLLINYKLLDGAPRHETVITRRDEAASPKSAFKLDIPAGDVKADMPPAPATAEHPGGVNFPVSQ